jgi:sporulation protein YlmC with PRC-barrel domain
LIGKLKDAEYAIKSGMAEQVTLERQAETDHEVTNGHHACIYNTRIKIIIVPYFKVKSAIMIISQNTNMTRCML